MHGLRDPIVAVGWAATPICSNLRIDSIFKDSFGTYVGIFHNKIRKGICGTLESWLNQFQMDSTLSIPVENSEYLSALLKDRKIPHNVLNARPKYVAREAEIVAQVGRKYAIILSTNMAGRGTDIILGGNPKLSFFRCSY
ncbi:hypothetical protein ACS0TY_023062 [Phlomoides rotata]